MGKSIFDINDDPLGIREELHEGEEADIQAENELLVRFYNTFVINPDGQQIFKWLIAQTGVYDSPKVNNFGDASQFLGKREIGLTLIEHMEACQGDSIMDFLHKITEGEEE